MFDKYYIQQHISALTLKAALKYDISPGNCHLGHLILQGLLERPNKLHQIDVFTNAKETNRSVASRTMRLASAMAHSGLKVEDRVIIMAHSHLDLIIPYFASLYNGYSITGLDPRIGLSEIKALFPIVEPNIVFCDNACLEKVKEAFAETNLQVKIVVFDDKTNDLEVFIREHKGTEINFRPALFDKTQVPAWLILTSGTTGTPKLVSYPYSNALNGVCAWWNRFSEKIDHMFVILSFHWMSTYMILVSTVLRDFTRLQSSIILTPQDFIKMINQTKPHSTLCTPNVLAILLKNCCDLTSFRHILIGGAYIDQKVVDQFRKMYPRAFLDLAYGQTELLAPIFDYNPEKMDSTPPGSIGTPLSKNQYKLVDDNGDTIDKPNTNGELWVKGDDFFKEYLNNPEETKAVYTEDGWLKTGDIFCRDENNYYYFVERKNIIFRYNNFWISPLQLEEAIKSYPGVEDACVVGIPDPVSINVAVAAIFKKEGHEVDPQELFDFLKGHPSLDEFKQLHGGIFFVDSFPYTPSGKINRARVKDLAMALPKILPK